MPEIPVDINGFTNRSYGGKDLDGNPSPPVAVVMIDMHSLQITRIILDAALKDLIFQSERTGTVSV